MFSRISDFGKTLTDEISRINEEVGSTRRQQNRLDPNVSAEILQAKTPDVSDITRPEELAKPEEVDSAANDTSKKPIDESAPETTKDEPKSLVTTPQSPSHQGTTVVTAGSVVPGTDIKYSDLPPEIQPKLRKYFKYEQKYPLLYEAYKTEKKKDIVLQSFEDVLKENTPCSTIADAGSFEEYVKGQSAKTKMLGDELRKSDSSIAALKQETDNLRSQTNELRVSNRDLRKQLRELKEKPKEDSTELVSLKEANQVLKKEKEDLKKENEALRQKADGEQVEQSEALTKKDAELQLANDALVSVKKTLAEKEALLAEKQEQITANDEQISQQKAQLGEKTTQLQQKSTKVEELEKSLESNKKLTESFKQKLDGPGETDSAKTVELEHSLEELQVKQQESTEKLEALEKENAHLHNQVRSKDEDIETLRDDLRDLGDDLVETKKQLKSVQSTNNEAQTAKDSERAAKEAEQEKKITDLAEEVAAKKAELELVRVQNSAALRDYEHTKTSLSKKAKVSGDESDRLRKEIKLKNDLIQTLNGYKSQSEELKKQALIHEKKIMDSSNRASILQEEKDKMNKTLLDLTIQVKQLSTDQHSHEEVKNDLMTKLEQAKKHDSEASLRLNKIAAENNRLVKEIETLRDKYSASQDLKASTSTAAEALKKRTEEMLMRNREFESRVDILQEELSQARSMLQERTRETGTMRKLLMESEEAQNGKIEELESRVRELLQERGNLQNSTAQIERSGQRAAETLATKLELAQGDYEQLKEINERLEQQLKRSEAALLQERQTKSVVVQHDSEPDQYSEMLDNMRVSLRSSEKRIKDLEDLNTILQKASNDNSQKLVRMNKKYKILSQQYRKKSAEPTPRSSRQSSVAFHAPVTPETPETPEEDSKEKALYIKNVLLGFIEHKEQREMLLPVIKTLLYLDDDDEQKLLHIA